MCAHHNPHTDLSLIQRNHGNTILSYLDGKFTCQSAALITLATLTHNYSLTYSDPIYAVLDSDRKWMG